MEHARRIRGVAFLLWAGAALIGFASAATLTGAGSDSLGTGAAAVADCDPDGFTVTHVLSATTVTDVIIGDIHANCAGGELSVTLTDLAGAAIGAGGPSTVPGGGGSVNLALTPTPDQSDIDKHRIRIVGP